MRGSIIAASQVVDATKEVFPFSATAEGSQRGVVGLAPAVL